MNLIRTRIPDVIILEPKVHGDHRGFFKETWRESTFDTITPGLRFVQDNHSRSSRGILRGLHYQLQQPQGKLVRVVAGEIFDVAVDMRRSSPTFGQWVGEFLSADNHRQLWVPAGFAHGFIVTSDTAEMVYKCTDYYAPNDEHSLLWNDPALAIEWPLQQAGIAEPTLSDKDRQGRTFADAATYA
ncbi:MAG: dTDP-4-dehydrorhamnose 3,5-epimerase [Gammaproteobacteria bacterium]|nr:dTDP-4-dehydrorhamnose 3,5-epimerase [Gammaproteobacteria bacterium]MDP2139751.1 dTDP-4-dehydrorhamnose 3,5-epimerase [Gammaproteobacteria bacterium]MDP2348953.1 dTDP-4-dehydrorhamnose 3,5-epimerase [Gammaproteobacteria bacterium]